MEALEDTNKPIDPEKLLELRVFLSAKKGILGQEAFDEERVVFIQNMRAKYGSATLNATALYHILIESTPQNEADLKTLDLPGGEIERFIKGEL